jgi:hypothetical protein
MHRRTLLSAAVIAAASLSAATATAEPTPPPAPPEVTVTLSATLLAKKDEIGERDLDELRSDLKNTVTRALARHQGGALHATKVALVLEDAKANRPTFAEMSRRPGLSMQSISLGGAKVTGEVTGADGQAHPLSVSYYSSTLYDVLAAATWSDAYRAFDRVGDAVVSGRLDQR